MPDWHITRRGKSKRHYEGMLIMMMSVQARSLPWPVIPQPSFSDKRSNPVNPVQLLCVLMVAYVLEPYFTKVYMHNLLVGAEKVLATLR